VPWRNVSQKKLNDEYLVSWRKVVILLQHNKDNSYWVAEENNQQKEVQKTLG
jgi:hypothetical protein